MLRNDRFGNKLTWNHLRSVQSSKGIGEPPLFLGCTVFFALREAVLAARRDRGVGVAGDSGMEERLVLDSPATCERLRLAVGDRIVEMTRVERGEGERAAFGGVA